ncbi:MAG: aldolase/citrate lyase family protein [Ignavibacteriales bacterium]|nr:aldolase/citrate lyase family protein [Ignavibacteriales bacterium]
MREHRLKQRLYSGQVVYGPFIKLTDPAIVEIAGHAGFDFVIIDTEHGPASVETMQNLIRAAENVDIAPIVRVTENNPGQILRAMDVGAYGIQVPQISLKSDAEALIRAAKFHPAGERGVCRYVRAAKYSSMDRFKYFREANEETLVIAHVEGLDGLANLPEIVQVDGLDVVFLGPYDLSQSCGVPGQVDHPKVIEAMMEAVRLAKNNGKIVGTFVESVEKAKDWTACGVQYISYSVDAGIFYTAYDNIVRGLKGKEIEVK